MKCSENILCDDTFTAAYGNSRQWFYLRTVGGNASGFSSGQYGGNGGKTKIRTPRSRDDGSKHFDLCNISLSSM
jgi:hypothetical protein